MGRKKGWVMTEEHKKALAEGRKRAKLNKSEQRETLHSNAKVIFKTTGKEKDAFDFFPSIRGAYRRIGDYISHLKLTREIGRSPHWKDPAWIRSYLATKGTVV